ncbi:MAG: ATP-binding domain-containing protein, partial [Clostridia bacterium]|nr:ATP-binding domain-containing protein [Clostridia bacterium]
NESLIITNAHRINEGLMPILDRRDADFFFLRRTTEEGIRDTVIDLVVNRLPRSYGEEIRDRIQVLTPSKKGLSGTDTLNPGLQAALNPPAPRKGEHRSRDRVFRVGDRVMQTKNNYSVIWEKDGLEGEGIFNGDIGTIKKIDNAAGKLTIDFDERICEYDASGLEELEHAWAITVHKSQGSEYPIVIMPLTRTAPMLLTRNLFYTAVTRAMKIVILVGRRDVIAQMVNNNSQSVRYTGLRDFITEEFDKDTKRKR